MVENPGSETIPVVFKVITRVQNPDGSEKNEATQDLSIFPPQMMLGSGQKKAVRVTYKGDTNFNKEKAYRVIAQQVPVNLKDKKDTGIKMLLKFQNALYVKNKKGQSKLNITSFQKKKGKIFVEVTNSGDIHQYLHNVKIEFIKKAKDKKGELKEQSLEVNEDELKKLEGQNILAQSKRVFEFNTLKGLTEDFQGVIKFD